jgi:hypothetical protein
LLPLLLLLLFCRPSSWCSFPLYPPTIWPYATSHNKQLERRRRMDWKNVDELIIAQQWYHILSTGESKWRKWMEAEERTWQNHDEARVSSLQKCIERPSHAGRLSARMILGKGSMNRQTIFWPGYITEEREWRASAGT